MFTRLLRSMASLSRPVQLSSFFLTPFKTPHDPDTRRYRFRLFPFRSPLLRESHSSPTKVTESFVAYSDYFGGAQDLCFLFLRVLRCFSSPGCLLIPYVFRDGYVSITRRGFPHSEIPGSLLTYSSPRHIGVRSVLLRLLAPRHPPCALSILTYQTLI